MNPRLYLVGQLLVGWHLQGATAPPGPESIDRMLAVADAILERMDLKEANAAARSLDLLERMGLRP